MSAYRVTKFNPNLRGITGEFLENDWTSVSDIGGQFKGDRLTLEKYLKVEDAYVETVRKFLLAARVDVVQVRNAEVKDTLEALPAELKSQMDSKACAFKEKAKLSGANIDWAVRLNLRSVFWCRLEGQAGLYIHFGYDYYMYLGTSDRAFVLPDLPPGMYAEPFESPYKK